MTAEQTADRLRRQPTLRQRVRSLARAASLNAGVLPDFLLLGAMRCGTTSLINYLYSHPCVLRPRLPSEEEVHYFDLNFRRPLDWYRNHFPSNYRMSLSRLRHGAAMTGESTPYYLFHPHAPARVAQTVPQARLLVLLRDPVKRALSHFDYMCQQGTIQDQTLDEALEIEQAQLSEETQKMLADPSYKSHVHRTYSILARGVYLDQIKTWHAHFPREQMLVLCSEDLYKDPRRVYREVTGFLGLPEYRDIDFMPHNPRTTPSSQSGQLRARLKAFYRPHNEALRRYLGASWAPSW
jgi:hypothetical protein